jgi:uncharacterized GH25 family protein
MVYKKLLTMINLSLTLVACYKGHEQFISVSTHLRQYPESHNFLIYPPLCKCHNRVDELQCHQMRNDIHSCINRQTEQTTTDNKSDKNVLSAYASALVTSVTESSYDSVSKSHHRHI